MRYCLLFASILVLLAFLAVDVHARLIAGPVEPDELFSKSDLVVIGEAIESKDTKDKTPANLVGVDTRIEVRCVMKGAFAGKELTVFHHRFKSDAPPMINGPQLVEFRRRKDDHVVGPRYLLFLKRMPDGRYEPTSGQLDPIYSVSRLVRPNATIADDAAILQYKSTTQPAK